MDVFQRGAGVRGREAVRGAGGPAPATHFLKGSKTPAFVATFMTIYS